MANTIIKISQLPNIGNGLNSSTLLPVVDTTGTAVTDKVTVGNVANFILNQAGLTLPQAYVSTLAQTVVNAAQPNITSVGTLNVDTLKISGGTNGYVLQTDGTGNLNWTAMGGGGSGSPGGTNTQVQFNDEGLFGGTSGLTFDKNTNTLGTVNIQASSATIYGTINTTNINATGNVTAGNIDANNFTVNNFTTVGNIEAPYFIGNGSALTGVTATAAGAGPNTSVQFNNDGVFAGDANLTWDAANASLNSKNVTAESFYGNITGDVVDATYLMGDGSNITNIGTVNYANNANTSNVANNVALANVIGIGNIAAISLDGSGSNVLYGNGVFAPIPVTTPSKIANGTSNVNIPTVNGPVEINVGSSQWQFNSSGLVTLPGGESYVNTINKNVIITSPSSVVLNQDDGTGNNATVAADATTASLYATNGSSYTNFTVSASGASLVGITPNLTVGNIIADNLGNISELNITGVSSDVLYGDGTWGPISVDAANVTGLSTVATSGSYNDLTNTPTLGNIASINLDGNVSNVLAGDGTFVTLPSLSGDGGNLSNINGSNITGQVSYAAVANSVAAANVSGLSTVATTGSYTDLTNKPTLGNIVAINLDGNGSNVLQGNGVWGPVTVVGDSNFANYAGNVTGSSQGNITSLGNLVNIQLNNTVTPFTANTGQMFWDTNERTMTLGMENGVQQQIGLEAYIIIKASAPITNGEVVMFTGANGDNVQGAPANVQVAGFKTDYIVGVATQDIATNGFGYITTFGKVHGLNTSGYNLGDILWLSTSTPGAMTNVQPTDPNFQVQMAAVTKVSSGDGHIQVRPTPYWALNKLTDVEVNSPTTGQALVYNGSNVWINGIPNIANVAFSVSGPNVSGAVANATYAVTAGTANSVAGANVTGQVSYAATANSVAGANVTGQVSFAAIANSVAVANVSGIGNIATLNLDGNASNILYGNGSFAAAPAGGGYGNSNVATFLASYGSNTISTTGNVTVGNIIGNGQALTGINGANVTGAVSYATVANSVAVANVSGIGNIATINLTGSSSTVLYGNGVFAAAPGGAPSGSNTQLQFNDAGAFGATANLTFNKTTNTLDVNGPIVAGAGASLGGLTNPVVSGTGNVDNYLQIDNWNASNTANSSSDFIAYPSNGTDASGWIDLGITSNAFTQAAFSVTTQNEGYIFMSAPSGSGRSGNLVIATDSTGANNSIEFYVGGFNQTKNGTTRKLLLTTTGANVTGNLNVSGNISATNIGNISSVNLDGNASNVLLGNGAFSAIPASSYIANGTSNVTIPTSGGNVITNVGGQTLLTVYSGGIKVGGSGVIQSPGGATAITVNNNGANIGTANITTWLNVTGSNGATVTNNVAINGGVLNTTASTANVFNVTPTTVNIAGGASIGTYIGNSSGVVQLAGNVQGNTNGFAIGYRDIPQLSLASNTTIALTDAGKHYYSTSSSNLVLTIANNSSVAYSTGATINIINQGTGNITVAQGTGVTLYMAGNSTSGNRTLSSYGVASITKVATDTWFISGVGLV